MPSCRKCVCVHREQKCDSRRINERCRCFVDGAHANHVRCGGYNNISNISGSKEPLHAFVASTIRKYGADAFRLRIHNPQDTLYRAALDGIRCPRCAINPADFVDTTYAQQALKKDVAMMMLADYEQKMRGGHTFNVVVFVRPDLCLGLAIFDFALRSNLAGQALVHRSGSTTVRLSDIVEILPRPLVHIREWYTDTLQVIHFNTHKRFSRIYWNSPKLVERMCAKFTHPHMRSVRLRSEYALAKMRSMGWHNAHNLTSVLLRRPIGCVDLT